MSKPLSLEKYTDTKTFYVGRRLKTDPSATWTLFPRVSPTGGILPSHPDDAVAAGWKGNPTALSPYDLDNDSPMPAGTWGIITGMAGNDIHVDAMFFWKSRGTIVFAAGTSLHCSNFVTSRGGPPLVGESESLAGVHTTPKVAAPVAAPVVATDADAALDAIRKLIGGGAAPMDEEALKRAVKEQLDPFREAMRPVLDILASLKSEPIAKARIVTAVASSKNPVVAYLAKYYTVGHEAINDICLAAPPSIGKTYAFRELGKAYDVYLEHGCTADSEEINTLLGSTAPDGKGGFVVFDGVLAQAVRTASTGKNVLLLLDEVLRLSEQGQVWLLTFLTGVKTPDGKKYRLRTRRVMADGTLEVIECSAANLHIGAAVNLGARSPNEAFWSRWHHHRLPFDAATVKTTAMMFATSYGIVGDDDLAEKFTAAVVASRAGVADGSLKYPLDFRSLENALRMAMRTGLRLSADVVCGLLAENVESHCAHWGIDSGETDPASATSVSLVKLALGVR
tara:strand:+ start:786 stop:2312 length:1527 start_codon:yes stop_codon:yes gene_type:complete